MAKDHNDNEKKEILLSIKAPSQWWRNVLGVLEVSSEHGNNSTENTSYLSCIYIKSEEGSTEMMTQSAWSTSHITVEGRDITIEGQGKYLLLTKEVATYISSMPTDGDITLEFFDTEYTVDYNDGEITFSSSVIELENEDFAPTATNSLPDKGASIVVDADKVINAYKMGSSMAKQGDKEVSAGYDPLSSCMVTIDETGMSVLTVSSGSAEARIEGKVSLNLEDDESEISVLTYPRETATRISKFSFMGVFTITLGEDKNIYLSCNNVVMKVAPINLGNKSAKLSYKEILKVMNPSWEARFVSAKIPAKELKSAMSRAKTANATAIKLTVMPTSVKVSSKSLLDNESKPFNQKITASTQWHDEGKEKYIVVSVTSDALRKIFTMIPENGEFDFDIAVNPSDEKPWGVIVHTGEDFNPETPHNFFILSTVRR